MFLHISMFYMFWNGFLNLNNYTWCFWTFQNLCLYMFVCSPRSASSVRGPPSTTSIIDNKRDVAMSSLCHVTSCMTLLYVIWHVVAASCWHHMTLLSASEVITWSETTSYDMTYDVGGRLRSDIDVMLMSYDIIYDVGVVPEHHRTFSCMFCCRNLK